MTARTTGFSVVALAALVLLAFVPRLGNAYYLALAISLLQYTVLATAWGMFSGPTRYVSLATTAFFGVGAYTVAVLGEILPLAARAPDRGGTRRSPGCRLSASRRCG
jgi:branched-chain amino acid transport system permease protein